MGLFSGKHEPPKGRDPRPKGSQKGVTRRDHQRTVFSAASPVKARTPWFSSGSVGSKKR